ncbi:RusA family crossover junction endodeoxyribonuclease [Alienimonas sp. DA493]|uniref:RusA family crossover junction endodeoxyribonuclease n=1 Tax=Alienimonas sp. DA493 TaxID=3373605 RepID=UPI003754861C
MPSHPTESVTFTVPGEPVPQPRPRVYRVGKGTRTVSAPKGHPVIAYKHAAEVAAHTHGGLPFDGALRVGLTFVLPRPKSKVWKRKPMPREPHTSRPDLDNYSKAILDGLWPLWGDDSQVCELTARKVIAAGDEQPHTEVTVIPLSAPDQPLTPQAETTDAE